MWDQLLDFCDSVEAYWYAGEPKPESIKVDFDEFFLFLEEQEIKSTESTIVINGAPVLFVFENNQVRLISE